MPNPKRPAYPAEFRAEAVRLARSPGVNGQVEVPTYGHEKYPPRRRSQAFVDGPPALVLASFIR